MSEINRDTKHEELGHTHNPEDSGPSKAGRSCTDVFWLVLFIVFLVGHGGVSYWAVLRGNPTRLVFPTDITGQVCGLDNTLYDVPENVNRQDLSERPALFWPNPLDRNVSICVEECFTDDVEDDELPYIANPIWCILDPTTWVCDYNNPAFNGTIDPLVHFPNPLLTGPCYCPYTTANFLGRCAPTDPFNTNTTSDSNVTDIYEDVQAFVAEQLNERPAIQTVFSDVTLTWEVIVGCTLLSALVSLIWICALRFVTGIMVFVSVIVLIGSFGGAAYVLYQTAESNAAAIDDDLFEYAERESAINAMRYTAYAFAAIDVIVILVTCCLRKQLGIATGVLKESSSAIASMWSIFVLPNIFSGIVILYSLFWAGILGFIVSSGEPRVVAGGNYVFEVDGSAEYALYYHMMSLYWVTQFIFALSMASTAGAIATWYWTSDKKNLPSWPVLGAVYRTIRFHVGSIAFGSFTIAIILFLKWWLKSIENQMKGSENSIFRDGLKWLRCCLTCLEKVLKYLNRNAYIEIAIYGYPFCKAAKRAATLILENFLRIGTVQFIGAYTMLISKVGIGMSMVIVANRFISQGFTYEEITISPREVTYEVVPLLLIFLLSYFVASAFLSVYEIAIDTIILCFCEDEYMNDGSKEHPYYMSNDLKAYVEKHTREPPIGDKA